MVFPADCVASPGVHMLMQQMIAQACHPVTLGLRQEDSPFKFCLGYRVQDKLRQCSKGPSERKKGAEDVVHR